MSNTVYTVQNDQGEVLGTRSRRQSAENLAGELYDGSSTIEVVTAAGNVVFSLAARGARFKPWTRVEQVEDAPEIPGFTPAYRRTRVGAVVYRANDKSGWLVVTEDGTQRPAANTAEARQITNDLAAQRREAQEAAKEADRQAKAEAKAAKAAEKARKAEEAEAAKLAKAEAAA